MATKTMYRHALSAGNVPLALSLVKKAAEDGDPEAQFRLAGLHYKGIGVPKDAREALRWFQRSAEAGHLPAQTALGLMYKRGLDVPRDLVEAAAWLKLAADKGDPVAARHLADLTRRRERAAAEAGKAAEAYRAGRHEEAVRLFRKAAEAGHLPSQSFVGWAYLDGQGVKRDEAEALRWLSRAAAQGHAKSQFLLGTMHERGRAVPASKVEAYRWYRRAAGQKHQEAVKALEALSGQMLPEELAEAQGLSVR